MVCTTRNADDVARGADAWGSAGNGGTSVGTLGQPTAIICDDDACVRSVISRVVEDAGYRVVAEIDVATHLMAAVTAVQPDLITLDLWLPGMSGLDAMREIRAASPRTRVVVFSAHDLWREKALALGAARFVEKPYFDSLSNAIDLTALAVSA
jgi:CheY-like chemotaxis protein